MLTRLNKYLADCGIASRRKAEELITEGRVEINGKTVVDLATRIDASNDEIRLDGEVIRQKKHLYILMNKPRGVVSTTSDEKRRKTVIDLLNIKEKVYPVGRLDYNTTGVLFLTNDGDFTNLLTHPGNQVPRVYEVKLHRPLTPEDKEKLTRGIYLDTGKGKFTDIHFTGRDYRLVEVTSVEGRNHFVKNMFGALGYNINNLNRKSYAGVTADIPKGTFRFMSDKEVKSIIKNYAK